MNKLYFEVTNDNQSAIVSVIAADRTSALNIANTKFEEEGDMLCTIDDNVVSVEIPETYGVVSYIALKQ